MKKINRKYLLVFGGMALVLAFAGAVSVRAEGNSTAATSMIAPDVKPIIADVEDKDLRQELSIKENVGRIKCLALGVCPAAVSSEATEALIKAAKVTEVGADFLKVSIFGYSYKIDVSAAKLVRNYWGVSDIDEYSVGDIVNVFGYLDASDNYLVHAKTVRNVSIQKVHNVFKGAIESIDATSSSFVIQTEERGRQTVVVSSDTKITVGGMPIVCVKAPCPAMPERIGSFADLQVGMKVIVRGLWDKALSKIQARLIVVAGAFDPRPFFQKENGLLKKFEKKHEDQIEKKEKKLEKQLEKKIETLEKPGEKDGILKRIEELNRMILEIQKKMGTASGSATTAPTAQ